jgi:hypothetical protein
MLPADPAAVVMYSDIPSIESVPVLFSFEAPPGPVLELSFEGIVFAVGVISSIVHASVAPAWEGIVKNDAALSDKKRDGVNNKLGVTPMYD